MHTSLRLGGAALAVASSMSLIIATAVSAHAVETNDPSNDVSVSGEFADSGFYDAIDLEFGAATRTGTFTKIDFDVQSSEGPELGVVTYKATMSIQQKAKKVKGRKVRGKPYKVIVTYNGENPVDPLVVTSSVSGSMKRVGCGDAYATFESSNHQLVYVPRSCFGKNAESAKTSFLVTGIEDESGVTGSDGLSLARAFL